MDKKLLDALANLSESLDLISQILSEKKSESATGKALEGGDFGVQLKEISAGVKQLQTDNKKILKNQETIIAISKQKSGGKYDKVSEVGSDPKQESSIKKGVGTILLIAIAVLAIGLAFKLVGNINFLSVLGLALAITIISIAFEKISKLNISTKQAFDTSLVMVMIAGAITVSSWILSMVKSIGFGQAVTAILISGLFTVLSYGLKNIFTGLKGVDMMEAVKVAAISPLIFIAMSLAIVGSSWILAMTKPIGFGQAITAILISALFVVLSYGLKNMMASMKGMNMGDLAKAVVFIPLIFIAISFAIMASSHILAMTKPVPFMTLLNILVMSVVLAISAVVIGIAAYVLSKIGITNIIKGGLAVIIIATTIMISSLILDKGTYRNYPDWKWALGVGLSIVAFAIPMTILGFIAMSGIGALAILAGAAMTLLVASTIVGTSFILGKGSYSNYPTLDWAMGVGLSMTAFGMATVGLGVFILGTLGFGYLALEAGSNAVLMIADTIVQAASILSKGKFTGGPTKEWAEGISISLGAFLPVYGMLMANSIMSIFGGGVGPEDFSNAIRTISQGIVVAASFFAKAPGIWKNGPTKEWAEGVGTAIGAFAPVYKVLTESKGLFSGGPSVEEMSGSIMTISQGIVDAANFFGANTASFDVAKIPSKEWGENVGGAIQAFIPALNFISENSGIFSNGTEILLGGIMGVTKGIVMSSMMLSVGKFDTKVPPNWVDSISGNIKAYIELAKHVSENYNPRPGGLLGAISGALTGGDPMSRLVSGMVKLSGAYDKLGSSIKNFGNSINGIDPEKLASIRAFTSNIVLMSIMDPDSFEAMLEKLEEKAGTFTDIISDINDSTEKGGDKKLNAVPNSSSSTPKPDPTQRQMLQILSSMDAKLGTIAKNSGTLADYTNEIRTGSGVKIKK